MTYVTSGDKRFQAMLREATERVLYVSPPYVSEKAREAFLSGYEAALKDIAMGLLVPRTPLREPSTQHVSSHDDAESEA